MFVPLRSGSVLSLNDKKNLIKKPIKIRISCTTLKADFGQEEEDGGRNAKKKALTTRQKKKPSTRHISILLLSTVGQGREEKEGREAEKVTKKVLFFCALGTLSLILSLTLFFLLLLLLLWQTKLFFFLFFAQTTDTVSRPILPR